MRATHSRSSDQRGPSIFGKGFFGTGANRRISCSYFSKPAQRIAASMGR
jgi:hypothetical protein